MFQNSYITRPRHGFGVCLPANVGGATLGALIGAGGCGQPILTGIRLDDVSLILEDAIPAAVPAIAVQYLFELAERAVVPRNLRMATRT
jgi:osmoprotectant transport system permease protein